MRAELQCFYILRIGEVSTWMSPISVVVFICCVCCFLLVTFYLATEYLVSFEYWRVKRLACLPCKILLFDALSFAAL